MIMIITITIRITDINNNNNNDNHTNNDRNNTMIIKLTMTVNHLLVSFAALPVSVSGANQWRYANPEPHPQ